MAVTAELDDGHVPVRSRLDHELLEAEAATLAELPPVRESLRLAVEAATKLDREAAYAVTTRAREFDRRYGEVHDLLLAVIARQAPVATDLRLAMALLHVNDRVERMAAQCLSIATMCCAQAHDVVPSHAQLACLNSMAWLADEQIAEAQRIFAERDVDGARHLRMRDAAINEHNRRCFAQAIEDGDGRARRESAMFVALMARAIERIGDNAVDIGSQAAFVVTGRLRPASAP